MNTKVLKWLNPLLFISGGTMIVTGLGMKYFQMRNWFEIHETLAPYFVVILLAHIFFNSGWIKATYLKKK